MMKRNAVSSALLALAVSSNLAFGQDPYFPERRNWTIRDPGELGMNAVKLQEAVDFAISKESKANKDLALNHELSNFAREPFGRRVGPTTVRAALNGLVVRNGYIVAEWGETNKVDMTFSVTKTFLSTTVGLAYDRGLIRDVHDLASEYVPTHELFGSEHNESITWDHLLRQTSDWEGTLWDKPDWADRPVGETPLDYPNRPMYEPGTHYKYNDVRVNLLALVTLHVWRRSLPRVLREYVMDPIGATNTWRWHGYENSWVMIDGVHMQSVSGGGHWGGGMHINARDMARFGYLFLRNGTWGGRRIISEEWIEMARTPGVNKGYGFMNWFLNEPYVNDEGERRRALPSAPENVVTFRGAGANIIYIDPENDLVVVVRWIGGGGLDEFIGKVIGSIEAPAPTDNASVH